MKRTGGRPVGELTQPIGIIIAARRWRALGDGRDRTAVLYTLTALCMILTVVYYKVVFRRLEVEGV